MKPKILVVKFVLSICLLSLSAQVKSEEEDQNAQESSTFNKCFTNSFYCYVNYAKYKLQIIGEDQYKESPECEHLKKCTGWMKTLSYILLIYLMLTLIAFIIILILFVATMLIRCLFCCCKRCPC